MLASAPSGAFTLGGAFFVGPLAAVRLQDRRQIAAHLAACNTLVFGVALFGGLSTAGVMMTIIFNAASWVLCFSCVVALEAAEAQGAELEVLVRRGSPHGRGQPATPARGARRRVARHGRTGRELSLMHTSTSMASRASTTTSATPPAMRSCAMSPRHSSRPSSGGTPSCARRRRILHHPAESGPEIAQRSANAVRAALAHVSTPDGQRITSGSGSRRSSGCADRRGAAAARRRRAASAEARGQSARSAMRAARRQRLTADSVKPDAAAPTLGGDVRADRFPGEQPRARPGPLPHQGDARAVACATVADPRRMVRLELLISVALLVAVAIVAMRTAPNFGVGVMPGIFEPVNGRRHGAHRCAHLLVLALHSLACVAVHRGSSMPLEAQERGAVRRGPRLTPGGSPSSSSRQRPSSR